MQGPRSKRNLAKLKHLDLQEDEAIRKTLNKTKISSLDSLGLLGVSPSVQGISRRGTS